MMRLIMSTMFLWLVGCTHLFIESDVRLQVENRTDFPLRNLSISNAAGGSEILWFQDSLGPGQRSFVESYNMVGKFHWTIETRDSVYHSDTLWRERSLGEQRISGGSVLWRIWESGSSLQIEVK